LIKDFVDLLVEQCEKYNKIKEGERMKELNDKGNDDK